MYFVFYSTSDVFRAEDLLKESSITCEIVPTPVTDKAYCGVCIKTEDCDAKNVLKEMEFEIIKE